MTNPSPQISSESLTEARKIVQWFAEKDKDDISSGLLRTLTDKIAEVIEGYKADVEHLKWYKSEREPWLGKEIESLLAENEGLKARFGRQTRDIACLESKLTIAREALKEIVNWACLDCYSDTDAEKALKQIGEGE